MAAPSTILTRWTRYYIVVSVRGTTTCCALLSIAALALAWGTCPEALEAAQTTRVTSQRREDPFKRFRNAEPEPAPLLTAEQAWLLTLPVPPSAGGAMDNQRVYIPIRDGRLVAIHRDTGSLIWSRPLETSSTPVVGDGMLFVVSGGAVSALDASSGIDLWTASLDAPVTAPLVWDTGWLVAVVEPGEVLAFRAADGRLVWRRSLGAPSVHPPVPGGENALYFSLADSRVVALGLADGKPLWERMLPGTLSEPAVARDRVFVGSTDNAFHALDADTGEIEWKWRGGGDVIGAAADGGVVYFASLDNIIRAVNQGNGNQRWRKETGTRPVLPPRAFGGIVVVAGLSPALTVFIGKTGAVMGTYVGQGNLLGSPLIDPVLKPFRVAFVTITREGVVEGRRPDGMMFREPAPTPLATLPGRPLARERINQPRGSAP